MKIVKIIRQTTNKFLNLFQAIYEDRNGKSSPWFFVSRKNDPANEDERNKIDAVVIVPFMEDKIILLKQYRVPVGDYVLELPAGIIDDGEDIFQAAIRELKEETGLDVISMSANKNQIYNSSGMTDESCTMVFAKVTGTPSTEGNESSEDIKIFAMDREDAKVLARGNSERISAKCWLILKSWADGFDWVK